MATGVVLIHLAREAPSHRQALDEEMEQTLQEVPLSAIRVPSSVLQGATAAFQEGRTMAPQRSQALAEPSLCAA